MFDLGECAKVALFAVTEGEDKPVKHPPMFPNLRRFNPEAPVVPLSVRSGEVMDLGLDWLRRQLATAREAGFA